jgi:hypothetical protein
MAGACRTAMGQLEISTLLAMKPSLLKKTLLHAAVSISALIIG